MKEKYLLCVRNGNSRRRGSGRLISNDGAMYEDDSDYPYCESCCERILKCAIKLYKYKPEPIFYGSGNLFMA